MHSKKKNKKNRKQNRNDMEDLKEYEENEQCTLQNENVETESTQEHEEIEFNEKSEQEVLKEGSLNVEKNEIKSTAVVKYSVPSPPDYIKLQCNTDLNLPPANWLINSAHSHGLQRAFTLTHKGFTSFRTARLYPDFVGDINIISDAETIKKLLKIPYRKEVVGMFVHRDGNTSLLDNSDIYKYFIQFSRNNDGILLWLRDFVMKNLSSQAFQDERRLYAQDPSRKALKYRSLVSKLMYYSLHMKKNERMLQNEVHQVNRNTSTEQPVLPNSSPDVEAPDSSFDDKYNRNVVWTFEDTEMLLGTDMPIFGGGEYPCISLRPRDMQQSINILTGIDYWLDNLMSNVPEVVMCYHLNGVVQKYDLINTEDLPQLKISKFSPKLIKDVAQNILSFLKRNVTKAGHTYWLFKDKGEEVIKLYDLSCLVPQNDKMQNPFTIPVAMLLYRVARNFMKLEKKKSAMTKMLLENCIKLLSQDKYPEIVSSSCFMLSEVYIPITTNPESPTFDDEDQEKDQSFDSDYEEQSEEAIKTLDLESTTENKKYSFKPPPPIPECVEGRCCKALCHIYKGLDCLQYFSEEPTEAQSAKTSKPIPMGYEKLNKDKERAGSSKRASKSKRRKNNRKRDQSTVLVINNKKTEPLPTWKQMNVREDGISWKTHLKILLYEKAILVFATLSDYYYGKRQYGDCFRNIRLLARCSLIMEKLRGSSQFSEDCLLGRAGDCCMQIFQGSQGPNSALPRYQLEIATLNEKENEILTQIRMDEDSAKMVYSPNLKCVYECELETPEAVILLAVKCYEEALMVLETDDMLRRLGNSLNEAGTYYLNCAKRFNGQEIALWAMKAESHLLRAREVFEQIKDGQNMALLHTNIAHMYQLFAVSSFIPGRPLTLKEKANYVESGLYYESAKKLLGQRSTNPEMWDNILWEYSLCLFNKGCLIQDNPNKELSFRTHFVELSGTFFSALKNCNLKEEHSRIKQCEIRAALIYSRFAAISFSLYLEDENPTRKEVIGSHAANLYQNSVKYYLKTKLAGGYFRTQMKLLLLMQRLSDDSTTAKMAYLNECIKVIVEITSTLETTFSGQVEYEPLGKYSIHESQKEDIYPSLKVVLEVLMKTLQNVLKNGLKVLSLDKNPSKDVLDNIQFYKNCYRISLSLNQTEQPVEDFIFDTLVRFKKLYEER